MGRSATSVLAVAIFLSLTLTVYARDSRLRGASRKMADSGWTVVHLEGTPSEIGFQHGYLLYDEIDGAKKAIDLSVSHQVGHSWAELRDTAKQVFWPRVPKEYREEIEGIAAGLSARGSKLDAIDLTAMNAFMEFDYYFSDLKRKGNQADRKHV